MKTKELILATVVYSGFFGLIGFTVWLTGSAWALWALLLTPSFKWDEKDTKNDS